MFWALGACAVVILLVLLVPLRFELQVTGQGRPGWVIEAVWLGLRLGRDADGWFLAVGRYKRSFSFVPQNSRNDTKRSMSERVRGGVRVWRETSQQDRRAYSSLIRAVWSVLHFTIRGEGRYGCSDPAVTAWIYGFTAMIGLHERFTELIIEPDFTQTGWWGTARIVLSGRVIDIIVPAGRFLWDKLSRLVIAKYWGGREIWQA